MSRSLALICTFVASMAVSLTAIAAQPVKQADSARALSDAERDSFIQMAMRSGGLPGLQAIVVRDNRIVWAKSYGCAVLGEPGPRRAMENDSILFSASIAKLLVTVAVLQQLDKGRLALDEDINKYVSFSVRNPAWPDVPITWRMLLTHTSSLNEEEDERASSTLSYGKDPQANLAETVEQSLAPGGLRYWSGRWRPGKPGSERIYSSDGFSLAALALQSVMLEPLDRYVSHAILKPLGMDSTSYWVAALPISRLTVGYASLRNKDGSYRFVPAKTYWAHGAAGGGALAQQMTCADYPSGCAHTSARDFAQLMLMLLNRGTANGVKILEPSSVQLMMTQSGFRNLDGWAQGLGLNGPSDLHGRQLWGHDGADRGASTAFYFDPKAGIGAIAFSNGNDPDFSLSYGVNDIVEHLISWFE
jgi:CubicO group peptidase (beta-lactamase class C family)